MSEPITDAQVGVNGGLSSPCVGRSQSPSQRQQAPAPSTGSRAAYSPASEASEPLTPGEPGHGAAETGTETDRRRGGPCVGREQEPEHLPGRRRNVLIALPAETYELLDRLVKTSGLPRAFFLTTALINGARRVVQDTNAALRGGGDK